MHVHAVEDGRGVRGGRSQGHCRRQRHGAGLRSEIGSAELDDLVCAGAEKQIAVRIGGQERDDEASQTRDRERASGVKVAGEPDCPIWSFEKR